MLSNYAWHSSSEWHSSELSFSIPGAGATSHEMGGASDPPNPMALILMYFLEKI